MSRLIKNTLYGIESSPLLQPQSVRASGNGISGAGSGSTSGRVRGLRGLGEIYESGDPIYFADGTIQQNYSDGSAVIVDSADGSIVSWLDADGNVSAPDASTSGTDWSWLTAVPQILTTAQIAYNTQKLLELNQARAAKGLPPISSQSIAPTVNVGLDAGTQKILLFAALGIAAVMLLKPKSK